MTFLVALRFDRISAPWIIDGSINAELFTIYVEQILAPTLSRATLSFSTISAATKSKAARITIRARGAHLIFLPPYSLHLDPTEQMFAKVLHFLRDDQPRNVSPQHFLSRRVRKLFSKLRLFF
ncbi:transposase [Bradyrhizobium retamae]|uniref:transposase n=1 Tax=Bradyrhizobium retamae TaxID=1300035 RepID=UPI0009EC2419|nr:transposase [Bradyrhizobium retamae]